MPTLTTISREGAFTKDTRDEVNTNFTALNNAYSTLTTATPASASAAGTAGMIRFDASYIYICTATDTWKRAAIATW